MYDATLVQPGEVCPLQFQFMIKDYLYDLPPELIAQEPLAERSASRLLSLTDRPGDYRDMHFDELNQLLRRGDLLVLNDTRVLPARLFGKKASGGKLEILLERTLDSERALVQIKSSKSPKLGSVLTLDGGLGARGVMIFGYLESEARDPFLRFALQQVVGVVVGRAGRLNVNDAEAAVVHRFLDYYCQLARLARVVRGDVGDADRHVVLQW